MKLAEAKSVKLEDLKHPEKDEDRAKNPEWLVMLGVCTHLGMCSFRSKRRLQWLVLSMSWITL